jgi:hypothetical protein
MAAIAQPSFTSGEFAPSLYARVDLARYYTALKTCRNFIVRPYGGVTNRPGTRFCTEIKNSAKRVRLIDFIFSSSQAYVLEVGEGYIRFIQNGAYVSVDDIPVEVVTPYLENDLAVLNYVQSLDVMTICHSGYKQRQLSRLSATSWTLSEFSNTSGPFLDINVDTGKTMSVTGGQVGTVTLVSNWDIFTADAVGRLLYLEADSNVQSESVRRWEVQKEITVNEIRRGGTSYYKALANGTTGTVRPSTLDGLEYDGDPGVPWQYQHSGYGIARITSVTDARHAVVTVLSLIPDTLVNVTFSKSITGAVAYGYSGFDPPVDAYVIVHCEAHDFATGNTVTISGVSGLTTLNATWTITVVDANYFRVTINTDQTYTSGGTAAKTLSATASYKWAFEAWGGEQGYPAAAIYHQQRQVFGGSTARPQTVWESRTAGFADFGQSNPILDDDAITFDLNSRRANEIRHFVGLRELVALTNEGAWVIKKDQNSPVPLVDFQGKGGASHVPPVVVGQKALFVMEKGGSIRSMGYFFESDSYEGKDLTMTGSHLLFNKTVREWAFQEVPFSTVWIVMDDGGLLGLTYMPEHDVVGWHRHDTDGLFESICSIPEGNEDSVYAVVKRTIGGQTKRYIERFSSRFFADIKDAFFVDSGLTYDGRGTVTIASVDIDLTAVQWHLSGAVDWLYTETMGFISDTNLFTGSGDVNDVMIATAADGTLLRLTITEYVSATVVKVQPSKTVPVELRGTVTGIQFARNTFGGLAHLEGKTVAVMADGNVQAQQVVTDGSITLESPATVVHVGLPYDSDFETLDLNVQGQSMQDKVKNVRSVTLIVEDTRGLQAGPDADHLLGIMPMMSGQYGTPVSSETGTIKANIISDWSEGGRVFVRQSNPLPATILAAIPEVAIGGA